MVGYGLCKFRENIMRKFLLPILTIVILAGCSDSGIAKESSQSEEQKNMNGGWSPHGQKTIQV